MPNVIAKEKPTEYKLRAFVGFLFLIIIFLVGFAYTFYYQQLSRVMLAVQFGFKSCSCFDLCTESLFRTDPIY